MVLGRRAWRWAAPERMGWWLACRVGPCRPGVVGRPLGWHDAPGDSMDRLPTILIFAGWDRMSARRRKVPLTTVASASGWDRPRHSVHGDRSCSGGVPARRD